MWNFAIFSTRPARVSLIRYCVTAVYHLQYHPSTILNLSISRVLTDHRFLSLIFPFSAGTKCSHMRATSLYIESIKGVCKFESKPCEPGSVCDTCGAEGEAH